MFIGSRKLSPDETNLEIIVAVDLLPCNLVRNYKFEEPFQMNQFCFNIIFPYVGGLRPSVI